MQHDKSKVSRKEDICDSLTEGWLGSSPTSWFTRVNSIPQPNNNVLYCIELNSRVPEEKNLNSILHSETDIKQ